MDHIVPLFNGGTNSLENMQAICPNGHALKSSLERTFYFREQRKRDMGDDYFENEETNFRTIRFINPEDAHMVDRFLFLLKNNRVIKHSKHFKDKNFYITD